MNSEPYYQETWAARAAEMAPPNTLETRIRAYLRLQSQAYRSPHAMALREEKGYGSELCVRKRERADTKHEYEAVPVTGSDILNALMRAAVSYFKTAGLRIPKQKSEAAKFTPSRQNIRRALVQLEEDGIIERRRLSDGRPLRELTEAEAKKLGHDGVGIWSFDTPRAPSPESVQTHYQDILSREDPKQVVIKWPPEMRRAISDITSVLKGLHLLSSPDVRLSENPTADELQAHSHAIETAGVVYRDTVLEDKTKPAAKIQASPFAVSSPCESGLESGPNGSDSIGKEPVPIEPLEVTLGVPHDKGNEAATVGRGAASFAGNAAVDRIVTSLASLGFCFDRPSCAELLRALGGAPVEQFQEVLAERMRRGRVGYPVVLRLCQDVSAQWELAHLMSAASSGPQELARQQAMAHMIMDNPAEFQPEDIVWAKTTLGLPLRKAS